MWYKFSQQNPDPNAQELNPDINKQNIPSGGSLEIKLVGGNFYMGPNDPPKQVQVETDSGIRKSIYLLHGTPDGMLVFGEPGNLQTGDKDAFKEWLRSTGKPELPFVSCYGNKIVGSSGGADELINASGAVQVGTKTYPDGTEKLVFSQ